MARPTRQEAVNRSLRTNQGKSVRSEDLKRYDEFFVDPIDSSVFRENTKQVVYGRRGSGKTLLFGTVNQAIQADFPQVRIMSFAYSATEFRSSADVADTATVKETANAYFRFFIDKLCADIEALADRALAKPELLESLTRGGEETASRRDKLELAVLELWELATYGVEAPRPSDLTSEWEGRDVSTTRRGRFGSAAAGLDLKSGPRLAFGASIGRGTGTEHQATIHNVLRTERRFRAPLHVPWVR